MIDASGENGDAAERRQCIYTDKSIHLHVDHFDHYIRLYQENTAANCRSKSTMGIYNYKNTNLVILQ